MKKILIISAFLFSSSSFAQNIEIEHAKEGVLKNYNIMVQNLKETNVYDHKLNFIFESSKRCLEERTYRLQKKEINNDVFKEIILQKYGEQDFEIYKKFTEGKYVRPLAIEVMACEAAGVQNTVNLKTGTSKNY